jgi:hypothetical protein
MRFLNFKLSKRMEETLSSFIDRFLGITKIVKNEENQVPDIFQDKYVKSSMDNVICSPVSHTVWVKGQSYAIIANSQDELNNKLHQFNHNRLVSETKPLEMNPLLFPNLYTEEQKIEFNGWIEKRDVWNNEYCPA